MSELLCNMVVESKLLTSILKAGDVNSTSWRQQLEDCCIRLTNLLRAANIPGTYPDHVWILADMQVLNSPGLLAPVVIHDGDNLLPAFLRKSDAEEEAAALKMVALKLPIV